MMPQWSKNVNIDKTIHWDGIISKYGIWNFPIQFNSVPYTVLSTDSGWGCYSYGFNTNIYPDYPEIIQISTSQVIVFSSSQSPASEEWGFLLTIGI